MKPRFVFVAGLHRTGTSLIARILCQHSGISAIRDAPVPEQEGCYLQGAIPHTARHGVPGHYATDPAQHLTEEHPLNTMETRNRLWTDWRDWFDLSRPWLLEKSPVNLSHMRLLQALFPTSKFIIVLRHPQYMAAALCKWSDRDVAQTTRYGLEAYRIMKEDIRFLHSYLLVRYEDLVASPEMWIAAMHGFLDLPNEPTNIAIRDGNEDYRQPPDCAPEIDSALAQWGYGGAGVHRPMPANVADPLRSIRDRVRSTLDAPQKNAKN